MGAQILCAVGILIAGTGFLVCVVAIALKMHRHRPRR